MKPLSRPLTVTEQRRELMFRRMDQPLPPGDEQLKRWQQFADDLDGPYSGLLEFFDSIPKFFAGAVTSRRMRGKNLPVVRRNFRYNECNFEVEIKPVIISPEKSDTDEERKEVLAGEREEAIYRVLRKMASDKNVARNCSKESADAGDAGVYISFTLHELRKRLEEVNRGWKWNEIKEAITVLAETPIRVINKDKKLEIYAGPYIRMEYGRDTTDHDGTRTFYKVYFTKLATISIVYGLYDRIHYHRLMALRSSLAQWLYETLVRQFRQATTGAAYKIQLSRIMREGPLRPYKELRNAAVKVANALDELTEQEVLASFPKWTKEVLYKRSHGGRPAIEDVTFSMYPSEYVVREVKEDNAIKAQRGKQLTLL